MTRFPPLTDRQLDEVLDALGDDGPVTADDLAALRGRVLRSADASRVDERLDEAVTIAPLHPGRRGRHRVYAVLVAAAVLAGVVVLAASLVRANRPVGPSATGTAVTCLVDPDSPSAAATERARAVLAARLTVLIGNRAPDTAVTVVPGSVDRLAIVADGIDPDRLAGLCAPPQPTFRPLVTPALDASTPDHAASANPTAAGSGDAYPTSDTQFEALSAADQQHVRDAVHAAGCETDAADAPTDRSVVACDDAATPTLTYLLGPAVIVPSDIGAATVMVPSDAGGTLQPVVNVEFGSAANARVADYTAAHNTGGTAPTTAVTGCATATTPCADFLAVVVGGAVVSTPVTTSEISGSLQISGAFDVPHATLLAAELSAGDLTLVAG